MTTLTQEPKITSNFDRIRLSGEYQDAVGKMVREHVHCCVSYLVSELLKVGEDISDRDAYDELQAVSIQYPEFDTDGDNYGVCDECGEGNAPECPECDGEGVFESGVTCDTCLGTGSVIVWESDTQIDPETDLCEECFGKSDRDPIEAYEHWVISDWLRRQLGQRDEMVGEVMGVTIWGRCTTGQSISMDDVMCQIYDATYATWSDPEPPKPGKWEALFDQVVTWIRKEVFK